jgi:glycosyltransferase involved in cell wall biosynthesis
VRDRRPRLISVIVTTYNWPEALDLVLDGLAHQRGAPYEVIVADDGSRADTAAVVEKWRAEFPVRLVHAWQPDEGFRAARARNLGAAQARGDYLVFLDGDCLCRPDFVETHARLAERGWFVSGRRVLLHPEPTARILADRTPVHRTPALLSGRPARGLMKKSHVRRLNTWPLGPLRKLRPYDWRPIQSFNLGVWREDLMAVGGFDESFVGYGFEDTDLALRLFRLGRKAKQGFLASAVLHLHHRQRPLPQAAEARFVELNAQTHVLARASMLIERT